MRRSTMKNKRILRTVILILALVLVLGTSYFNAGENDFDPVIITNVQAESVFPATDDAYTPDGDAASLDDADLPDETVYTLDEHGSYDSKEEVALFIRSFGRLPDNYITKAEAEKAGWNGGSVEKYCPGKCIGGSRFGNYEGLLPDKDGREWTECDINTLSASSRGAERLVFSNDGLIYYTPDHYSSFELLYGEP